MAPLDTLAAGWTVWHAEVDGRLVLAYRPDVFDGEAYPPAWLPTVTVAPGRSPDARPEARVRSGSWYVACYLEPDVRVRSLDSTHDDRDEAVERAIAVADQFARGALDLRGAYHDPPEDYLERLEGLVGSRT